MTKSATTLAKAEKALTAYGLAKSGWGHRTLPALGPDSAGTSLHLDGRELPGGGAEEPGRSADRGRAGNADGADQADASGAPEVKILA